MTEASAGLRKALARNAGVSKLTTEELLAQMSEEQKTALAASIAPPPAQAAAEAAAEPEAEAEEGEGEGEGDPKSKKKDKEYMGEDAKAKAATERAVAVMSSEHVAGRTKLAADLLANDKLSADEIISILSASAPANTTDPEDAARAEMKAALTSAGKSNIAASGGTATPNASGSVWDKSYAKLGLVKPGK